MKMVPRIEIVKAGMLVTDRIYPADPLVGHCKGYLKEEILGRIDRHFDRYAKVTVEGVTWPAGCTRVSARVGIVLADDASDPLPDDFTELKALCRALKDENEVLRRQIEEGKHAEEQA